MVKFTFDNFKTILDKLIPFVSLEESRPVLQGIKLECKDNRCEAVALDGYRMGVVTVPCECEGEEDFLIRPIKAGKGFRHVTLEQDDDYITIKFSSFSEDTEVKQRKFAGDYVNWRSIWPKSENLQEYEIGVNPRYLVEALKPFIERGDGRVVRLTFGDKNHGFTITRNNDSFMAMVQPVRI